MTPDTVDDGRIPEHGRCVREVVEEAHSGTQQHRCQIDLELVEQPRVQALLDRLGAMHGHSLGAGSRFRSGDGAFDPVRDELDGRAWLWPAVGYLVGEDEGGHIQGMLTLPAVGGLECAPTREEGTHLGHEASHVLGAAR